jgi:ATP-dependent 26S proteasome regulatory subunit
MRSVAITEMAEEQDRRQKALVEYRKKLMEHREIDARLKSLRERTKDLTKDYEKSENDLKALQSVGQIVGEVLRQLTEEKCTLMSCQCIFFVCWYFVVQ